jgi:hypothetical protein
MEEEPWWYMYNKRGMNSEEAILKARDHILEQNPTLRVVGAHLGSLEASFADLGAHLDRYPNFASDMAGLQSAAGVRDVVANALLTHLSECAR